MVNPRAGASPTHHCDVPKLTTTDTANEHSSEDVISRAFGPSLFSAAPTGKSIGSPTFSHASLDEGKAVSSPRLSIKGGLKPPTTGEAPLSPCTSPATLCSLLAPCTSTLPGQSYEQGSLASLRTHAGAAPAVPEAIGSGLTRRPSVTAPLARQTAKHSPALFLQPPSEPSPAPSSNSSSTQPSSDHEIAAGDKESKEYLDREQDKEELEVIGNSLQFLNIEPLPAAAMAKYGFDTGEEQHKQLRIQSPVFRPAAQPRHHASTPPLHRTLLFL